jgi:hypothetical protein
MGFWRRTALPDAKNWKAVANGKPEWRRDGSEIVLSWSGTMFARKSEHARGKWFTADLTVPSIKKAAEALSQSNHWPSTQTKITVPADRRIPFSGDIEVIPDSRILLAKNNINIILPHDAKSESLLDAEEFLRCVATEGADVSPPPEVIRPPEVVRTEARRITTPKSDERIPGLIYVPNVLSEAHEAQIVAAIDRGPWRSDLKRRVQHFGTQRYTTRKRRVSRLANS